MDSLYSVRPADPYLIFSFRRQLYAIKTLNIREILWLPELSVIEEFQPHVVGMFNLRGKIVPVADIDLLFGHPQANYQTSDSVVVIEAEGKMMGIIVNEVLDVKEIAPANIDTPLPEHRTKSKLRHHYLAGEARSGGDIIMILDAGPLLKNAGSVNEREEEPLEITSLPHYSFCPDATAKEKTLFRERASNLSLAVEEGGREEEQMPLAVAGLGGELFGVEVALVREFTDIRNVTPVPCCPPRIIGNMNLRGNIITLVDIRGLLNIPFGAGAKKAIIAEVGESVVGIAVNDVFDVAYLRRSDLAAAPSASAGKYVKGVAPYGGGMMTVIDLKRIIEEGELIVSEEA